MKKAAAAFNTEESRIRKSIMPGGFKKIWGGQQYAETSRK